LTEDKFLKRLREDKGEAFEELFKKYFAELYNYAYFYTDNKHLAEDLVHDVFYKIWESRKTIKIHTSLKSYLFRSVHNTCIQYLRHQKVLKKFNQKQQAKLNEALIMDSFFFETGLDILVQEEIGELVQVALNKLPEKTRHIFLLSRNENMKNSEIGEELGISEKTIEYHISRALLLLRKELKDYLP